MGPTSVSVPVPTSSSFSMGALQKDMARTNVKHRGLLNLPTELVQEIGVNLKLDDLANFRLVCKSVANVTGVNSFWRLRVKETFDIGSYKAQEKGKTFAGIDYRSVYHICLHFISGSAIDIHNLTTNNSKKALTALKTLIINAYPEFNDEHVSQSRNFELIVRHCENNGLLCPSWKDQVRLFTPDRRKSIFVDQPIETAQEFEAIRATLGPLMFQHITTCFSCNPRHSVQQFAYDQRIAYSSVAEHPILLPGLQVNLTWVNSALNFFSYYADGKNPGLPGRFWDHYDALRPLEKPQLWNKTLEYGNPKTLGRVWKGTYSYLERNDIPTIRFTSQLPSDYIMTDKNISGATPVQLLKMWVPGQPGVPSGSSSCKRFERAHGSFSKVQGRSNDPAVIKANNDTYPYEAIGWDDEYFSATGHITPLPDQQGIPGFQRITMIKYFKHEGTDNIDWAALWAYDGVILPGGQIIVGRWWAPENGVPDAHQYSGPFILWNIDAGKDKEFKTHLHDHEGLNEGPRELTSRYGEDDEDYGEEEEEEGEEEEVEERNSDSETDIDSDSSTLLSSSPGSSYCG